MFDLEAYTKYWQRMVLRLPSFHQAVMSVEKSQMKKQLDLLPSEQYPALVYVLPSFSGDAASEDDVNLVPRCLVFVLQRMDEKRTTDLSYQQEFEQTLSLMVQMIEVMLADRDSGTCTVMRRLNAGSMFMDPEYNLAGCVGWSLSFDM